ncbi:MAG: hypothetical protein WCO66_04110 [Candidatus Absconditabacteria bacterium]
MKKIVILSVGLLSLTATSFSFANGTGTGCTGTGAICQLNQEFKTEMTTARTQNKAEIQTLKDQEKTNKETIEMNRKSFVANFSGARSYLTKPLTADQKQAVNSVITTKETAMKSLQTTTNALVKSGTVDRSGYITQAESIITAFRSGLLPYVATNKTADFDTFIQGKINSMIINVGIRQSNQDIKIQIGNKKVAFKERLNQKKTEHKNIVATMKTQKVQKTAK